MFDATCATGSGGRVASHSASGCASGAAGMLRACIRFPGAPDAHSMVPTADATIDVALRPVARAS